MSALTAIEQIDDRELWEKEQYLRAHLAEYIDLMVESQERARGPEAVGITSSTGIDVRLLEEPFALPPSARQLWLISLSKQGHIKNALFLAVNSIAT